MDVNLKGQIPGETPDEKLNPPTRAETKLAIKSMSSGITADLLTEVTARSSGSCIQCKLQ